MVVISNKEVLHVFVFLLGRLGFCRRGDRGVAILGDGRDSSREFLRLQEQWNHKLEQPVALHRAWPKETLVSRGYTVTWYSINRMHALMQCYTIWKQLTAKGLKDGGGVVFLTSVINFPRVLVRSRWAARLRFWVRTLSLVVRYSKENSLMILQNWVILVSRTEYEGWPRYRRNEWNLRHRDNKRDFNWPNHTNAACFISLSPLITYTYHQKSQLLKEVL